MNLSMNEVQALTKAATHGAGMPWALATEAALSSRALAECGIDPFAGVLHLCAEYMRPDADLRPSSLGHDDRDARGPACPILSGLALLDRPQLLRDQELVANEVVAPVLFAGMLLRFTGYFEQHVAMQTDQGISFSTKEPLAAAQIPWPDRANLSMRALDGDAAKGARPSRLEISPETYQKLQALQKKTYAPASEASRASGAGSTLSDND